MTQPYQAVSTADYDPTVKDWGTQYDVAENKLRHGIDMSVEGGAFASVRNPAWHNLGHVTTEQVTALELLELGGCRYEVFKAPVQTTVEVAISEGSPVTVPVRAVDPSKVNLCRFVPALKTVKPWERQLQILGQAAPNYKIIQNEELFVDFADALVDVAEPTVSACGALFDGRQAFMSWKLPKGILVGGVDASELWMVAHTSHDGSRKATVAIVPLRVVCQNTLRVALGSAVSRWEIKHTAKAQAKLTEARESLKLAYAYAGEWDDMANWLVETKMPTPQFEKMITKLWGPGDEPSKAEQQRWNEKAATLLDLFDVADTQANVRKTAWAAFNAVAEHVDWNIPVRKAKDPAGAQFWRSLDGETKTVQQPKEQALAYLKVYAGI